MSSAATLVTRPGFWGVARRRRSRGNVLFWSGLAVLAALVFVAIAAPLIAPYDPNAVDLSNTLSGPSWQHLLGTDEAGRDTLSRLIYGSRTSLLGPLGVVVGSAVIGTSLGVTGAWLGGRVDRALARLVELAWAFPGMLLAILTVALFGVGQRAVVIALAIAYVPYMARLSRGVAVLERARPYISALELQGFGGPRIAVRHLLPNLAPFLLAQAALLFGYALIDLAGLSFLGFGVQPPTPDWGTMMAEGQSAILQGVFIGPISVGIAIVVSVVAFNLVGEGIATRVGRVDA